jgi:hypothetical protein
VLCVGYSRLCGFAEEDAWFIEVMMVVQSIQHVRARPGVGRSHRQVAVMTE